MYGVAIVRCHRTLKMGQSPRTKEKAIRPSFPLPTQYYYPRLRALFVARE